MKKNNNIIKIKRPSPVVAELKRIASENGGLLQPETVVEEARPSASPLHSKFDWNDTTAAHKHRLHQARQLIAVSVEVLAGTDKESDVFVSLSQDRVREHGGYRMAVDVLSDHDMREQMLHDALEELNGFQQRYQKLKELASIFASFRKVARRHKSR